MATKKPSSPWRVTFATAGSPYTQPFRSERAAYEAVNAEKQRIAEGISRVIRIRVEKWSVDYGRWELFEIAYPE